MFCFSLCYLTHEHMFAGKLGLIQVDLADLDFFLSLLEGIFTRPESIRLPFFFTPMFTERLLRSIHRFNILQLALYYPLELIIPPFSSFSY